MPALMEIIKKAKSLMKKQGISYQSALKKAGKMWRDTHKSGGSKTSRKRKSPKRKTKKRKSRKSKK